MMNIKNCPFCGGESKLENEIHDYAFPASSYTVKVCCTKCYAEIDESKALIAKKKKETTRDRRMRIISMVNLSIENIVSKWNNRHSI